MIYKIDFYYFRRLKLLSFHHRRRGILRSFIFSSNCFKHVNNFVNFPFSVPPEPIWCLDRRESGHLFWKRESSKVKFRCEVEVLEFVKDPNEDEQFLVNGDLQAFKNETISHPIVVCATCICMIAVTVLLPYWFLIGSS